LYSSSELGTLPAFTPERLATTARFFLALRYGFTHLGRFSAYYQSAFGELPSTTLRRRRQPMRHIKLSGEV
jgi:hypothetical protein